jgi:hypothetical protein
MGTTIKHIDLSGEEPGPRAIMDGISPGGRLPLVGGKATLRATHALLLPAAVYLGLPDRRQFK